MKAIEQYFHVVLFIMLYKVIICSNSECEALQCDEAKDTTTCNSFVTLLTITIIIFRGEVINGGFGLVLDGSQVSFVFVEQTSILNAGNNYFPFSNHSGTILTSHA